MHDPRMAAQVLAEVVEDSDGLAALLEEGERGHGDAPLAQQGAARQVVGAGRLGDAQVGARFPEVGDLPQRLGDRVRFDVGVDGGGVGVRGGEEREGLGV